MRKVFLFVAALLISLSFSQDKAGSFTLKNMKGEDVSLADFEGKVVVLDWYATWCSKCRAAFPELKPFFNKVTEEFSGDVVVLAINLDKKPLEKIAAFVKKQKTEYTTLHDPEATTGKSYNLKTLPLIMVIGKDGNVVKKFVGHKKKKTIKAIHDLLVSLTAKKG